MLILLNLLFTRFESKQPRADNPCLSAEKLGPQGTIAKEMRNASKNRKKAGKMRIFLRYVEITAKTAVTSDSNGVGAGPGLNWRQFSCSKRGLALAQEASQRGGRTHSEVRSKSSEIGVEVGDGLDAAEIVFEAICSSGHARFHRGAETEQNARTLKVSCIC